MPYGKNKQTQVELCHARSVLRQRVDTLLRGSGLKIRELTSHQHARRNPHTQKVTVRT